MIASAPRLPERRNDRSRSTPRAVGVVRVGALLAVGILAGCGEGGGEAGEELPVPESGGGGAVPGAEAGGPSRDDAGPSRLLTALWLAGEGGSVVAVCGEDRVVTVDGPAAGALDRAVRLARPGTDGPVRVTVRGRVVPGSGAADPAAAGAAGAGRIRVDEVVEVQGAPSCPGETTDRALEGTAWQLAGLPAPDPAVVGSGAWLRLRRGEGFVEGHTGCRELGGRYDWTVTRLRFQGLGPGAEACPGSELHAAFLEALARTGSYRIRGDTLELLGEAGPVATFRAPDG